MRVLRQSFQRARIMSVMRRLVSAAGTGWHGDSLAAVVPPSSFERLNGIVLEIPYWRRPTGLDDPFVRVKDSNVVPNGREPARAEK